MAAVSHCLYCFDVLSASLEHRRPLSLAQTEELWEQYLRSDEKQIATGDEFQDAEEAQQDSGSSSRGERSDEGDSLSPPSHLSRRNLLSPSPASSSSTPSITSVSSSAQTSDSGRSAQSSRTSLSSTLYRHKDRLQVSRDRSAEHPLFVTWNCISKSGTKTLRGCIGTFESQSLESGLKIYALTSAFEDTRFQPIALRELPLLECGITLLTDFETCADPMSWTLGQHGLRISFTHHSKRYGSTYLPDVPREQGWTKTETIISLMRKAGWNGRRDEWRNVEGLQVVRYQGTKVSVGWEEWKAWRDWMLENGLVGQDGSSKNKLVAKLKMWE